MGRAGAAPAAWAFGLFLAWSWWQLVFRLGADRWFFLDGWPFLSERAAGDVFEPFNGHLVAVPLLVYRGLYRSFGLDYTPYLAVLVSVHLGVAILLRVVMRRSGVRPWLSTAGACGLVLFGSGEENIQWAFQIGMVGGVLFGLAQLLLSDHDGPIDRRDALGVLAGLLAVLSTGTGPIMVFAVGVAVVLRRGWRPALLHTAPPAMLYLAWYAATDPASATLGEPPALEVWRWVREGQVATITAFGHWAPVAVALTAMLVIGLVLMFASTPSSEIRRTAAPPLALLACVPLFFYLVSRERWILTAAFARTGRYLYVALALLLPALALAAEHLSRRWRPATPLLGLLLVAGIPGNFARFGDDPQFGPAHFAEMRQVVLGLAHAPEADQVPAWVEPVGDRGITAYPVTIGFLVEARNEGRLPHPGEVDPRIARQFPIRLGLAQVSEGFAGGTCSTESLLDLSLRPGDRLRMETPVEVSALEGGEAVSDPVHFDPLFGDTLAVQLPSLDVRLTPTFGQPTFTICVEEDGANT